MHYLELHKILKSIVNFYTPGFLMANMYFQAFL